MANEIKKDEILSEEELEQVAGGTIAETVKDTQFLHALGLMDRSYTAADCKNNFTAISNEIDDAIFHLVGNHSGYYTNPSKDSANTYHFRSEGEETQNLTREQFLQRICYAAGKGNFDYKPYL